MGTAGCRVADHSWRRRKTGAVRLLLVMWCHAAKAFFTLYPPGFAPYARQSLVAADSDRTRGEAMGESLAETAASTASDAPERPPRRTAGRHVGRLARMLGVDDWRRRSRLARLLGVGAVALRDLRREWCAARTQARRAALVLGVLEAMWGAGVSMSERLLGAAGVVGLAGESYRCDRDGGRLRPLCC